MHKLWFLPMITFSNLTCCSIFQSFIIDSLEAHGNVHPCKNQVVFSSQHRDNHLTMAFTKCLLQQFSATSQLNVIFGYNATQQLESPSMDFTLATNCDKLDKIVASICTTNKQKGTPSNGGHMIDLLLLKSKFGSRSILRPHKVECCDHQHFGYNKWVDINFMNKVDWFGKMCARNNLLLHFSTTCVNNIGIIGTGIQEALTLIYGWLSGDVNTRANLAKPKAIGVKGSHDTNVSLKLNMNIGI